MRIEPGDHAPATDDTSAPGPASELEGFRRESAPRAEKLLADVAYERFVAKLWDGEIGAGEFVSIPTLVRMLAMPLAAVRETVKRAEARYLVSVLPKRGVSVMAGTAAETRECLDLRSILEEEGARRLITGPIQRSLDRLRAGHRQVLDDLQEDVDLRLSKRVGDIDLSLHDFLATGLGNPSALEVYKMNRDRISIIQNTRPLPPARIASAMEEHLAIIDALEDRNTEAAVHAIRAHCWATLRWWGVLS